MQLYKFCHVSYFNTSSTTKENWRNLIESMSDISKSSYRKNLTSSTDFIRYFKTVTPHLALGKLSIGSRPSKRKIWIILKVLERYLGYLLGHK